MKFKMFVVFVAFWTLGPFALAQQDEVAKLEAITKDTLDILYNDAYSHYTYEQQEAAIRSILEKNYDLTVIIRRTLARNWNLLSSEEQLQIKELVTKLVVKAYIEGVKGLGCPTIDYGELVKITDKRFEIPSVISFSDGKVFNIVYRFGRLKSGWQIYDIVAEDVSVVSNYRQQFDDHFRRGTGAELIEKLEKFIEEGKLDESTKL